MTKIRLHLNWLFASDRPKWKKREKVTEVVAHTHDLADALLSDGYDFDDLDDALAIAIYEDRRQAA
ncbi:MAG: hypothetical protein WD894_17015 [Pirellulales bacterium]